MSIEGQLSIKLNLSEGRLKCELSSSRPLQASRLFIGKPIDSVLKTIPMLFNICGKAQAIATLRAAESYTGQTANESVEIQREALIWLESLREQLWQILLEWPKNLAETVDAPLMASISQSIHKISQSINHNDSLLRRDSVVNIINQQEAWHSLKQIIENDVLGEPYQHWLNEPLLDIEHWATKKANLASRFVHWLQQQIWQNTGTSPIAPLTRWDNSQLQKRLTTEQYDFTQTPDWNGQAHEVSWFSSQQYHPMVEQLLKMHGNGIYTRVITRLVGLADLTQKLDRFFSHSEQSFHYQASNGMAHVEAARGRLTHNIKMNGGTVEQLNILAPTEWNFHPNGVAATGLENLQGTTTKELEQQAHCLIHAIDPCVGYSLSISTPSIA